jgi:hypothetical protein
VALARRTILAILAVLTILTTLAVLTVHVCYLVQAPLDFCIEFVKACLKRQGVDADADSDMEDGDPFAKVSLLIEPINMEDEGPFERWVY